MGGSGSSVGDDLLANSHSRLNTGQLVGLHDFGMGRVLGLGSCGKLGAHAVARIDSVRSFNNGAEEAWDVSYVEHYFDHHRLLLSPNGHVHQPRRSCSLGAFLCRVHDGLDISVLHGTNLARVACGVCVARGHTEE